VVRFVMSDCRRDPRPRLSWWLTFGVSWVVRHVSWFVVCRCGARRWWSATRWRSSRDVPCRWTRSGEGRMWGLDWRTRRRGDQSWWLTPGTLTNASEHESDCVDQVKIADMRVEWGLGRLGGPAGRGRWWHMSSSGDAYGVRYSWRVLRVWASKHGWRF
jgi:hypothetical protein